MQAYASIWLTLVDGQAIAVLRQRKNMPLVRIDIRKGKDTAYRQEIGRVVYDALIDTACLILDVRMPSMGGFELQRRLATGNYRIPIIFITAYDSDDVHIQALQAGAAGLLCKPFSQESLFEPLRSALVNQHDIQHES